MAARKRGARGIRKDAAADTGSTGDPKIETVTLTHVRIVSSHDGFRRAGMAHSKAPTITPIEQFTEEELAALEAEPRLTVDLVEAEVEVEY